jgi:hypothetical protein
MSVCCVLSGRGLCDEPITRPEESYRLWCVVVCDLEISWMRRMWPTGGGGGDCRAKNKKHNFKNIHPRCVLFNIYGRYKKIHSDTAIYCSLCGFVVFISSFRRTTCFGLYFRPSSGLELLVFCARLLIVMLMDMFVYADFVHKILLLKTFYEISRRCTIVFFFKSYESIRKLK